MSHSSLILSTLAHIGLLILAAVGLPALHDPPDPFEMAVPVTVTMVSERTEAKAPLPPPEPLPPEAPPEPEPVAAEPPPVETPPIETPPADPPKPEEPVEVAALTPEPPKPEPLLPEPEPLPPEPESVAAPLPPSPPEPEPEPPASDPKPAPLPQRPPQQQARAKAPPKPPEPAPDPPPLPQIAPKDPPDELAALRKAASGNDLDKLRSALANKTPVPVEEAEEAVFTVSEKHRLFRQLSRCWQTIPGLAPSERHVVVLQVELGPDRRVTSVKTVDGQSSRSYRAAQERARRALGHPFCEQLDVPPGKIALWKSLTLRFDPHRMQ
ncbi:MAG: hypothetical protein OXH14_12040 [Alphaproteobacteria bacterium]|nr:hypothetical protein [Alphaproteobacteria bacterium]